MSKQYPGGIISKTPPVPSGNYADSTAPGIWTLEQQAAYAKLGQWPTAGNVNPSAFIENLFSTYLYTGDGATQTIANGVNLAGEGGMVWVKNRGGGISGLMDSARGESSLLLSYSTAAENTGAQWIDFLSNGFNLVGNTSLNQSSNSFVSWTFREQAKFFDVVTYTGNGSAGGQTISHNLTSAPGCIIVKRTDATEQWRVYHVTQGVTAYAGLNSDAAFATDSNNPWKTPTTTTFGVGDGTYWTSLNASGGTYVAYLFAQDAGGFGLTGTDNVISCGSFTTPSSGNATITLGYEPQWLMVKRSDGTGDWYMVDTLRGFSQAYEARVDANLSSAEETTTSPWFAPTSTGFTASAASIGGSRTFIYIAIRKGPMAVPTDATKVFAPVQYTSATTPPTVTTGFPVDMIIDTIKGPANESRNVTDRLRGSSINLYNLLFTNSAAVTSSGTTTNAGYNLASNTSTRDGFFGTIYGAGYNCISWNFRRAPSFFDEVCYTGTNGVQTVPHNLTVAPELMFIKNRTGGNNWAVYSANLGITKYLTLNEPDAATTFAPFWGGTTPTSTNFYLGGYAATNNGGDNYAAYLFATCAGVSKVGSYTGTGSTQTIACGFAAGARFVLIKRTDSTGDWWVWDTSRGMVSGTDPRLGLNIATGESTGNWVFTATGGFEIVTTDASVNASGGTYIFLAIA
jgi:hypothetical protein